MTTLGRLKNTSIAAQLTWVNLLVSGSALLLAAGALAAYDRASFRESTVQGLSIQSQISATNCISALVFNDPSSAQSTLAALNASPNVISATIFTTDGRVFAAYQRDRGQLTFPAPVIPAGQAEIHEFGTDRITVARRIAFQGRSLGSVSISADLQELNARRSRTVGILAAVLLASILMALFVSRSLQRVVSGPIVALADLARRVSGDRDYSVRAKVTGSSTEMRVMIDAFNDMLTQIGQHERSLRLVHDQLEERVRDRTAELDASNKELEAFSYSVSHDLRAPLRHVIGFANLVEAHAKDHLDEQGRRYLQTITNAATRMGALIDDLLTFSRMNRAPLGKRRVSLDELVRDARQEVMAHGANDREIEWHVDHLPDVEGDPALLRLAVVNLLSNALKYTAPRARARIDVGAGAVTSDEVVVFVRDNGVGFDMQYVHKLFGVFQRLHNSDEFEGTGIGLANVKRIISRHGGRVWADSTPDQGATFSFSLPVQR